MRIFVGIKLSKKLAREILAWQERYRASLPVRFIVPHNLHITLVPPWYEKDIERLRKTFARFRFRSPFEIQFERVTFGPPSAPRLIWAEGVAEQSLVGLQQKLFEHFKKEPEKRELKLHATLARFRPEAFRSFPIQTLDEDVSWNMIVSEITLFESVLRRTGAEYNVLDTIIL